MKRRAVITTFAAALAGLAAWHLLADPEPRRRDRATPKERPPSSTSARREGRRAAPGSGVPVHRDRPPREVEAEVARAQEPAKLEPTSPAFITRVDDVIPARLYREAAHRCYDARQPPDQKVRLAIRLRIEGGELYVHEATVLDGTVQDPGITECIRSAVAGATWREDDMPDWEGEDELLVRLGGMKKHFDVEEQDDSDEGHWPYGQVSGDDGE